LTETKNLKITIAIMSQETSIPDPQDYKIDEFLFSTFERTARWQRYRGPCGRVLTFTNYNGTGQQRDIHLNPLTEDFATYHGFPGEYDRLVNLPLYRSYISHSRVKDRMDV
jgi:hypothetical protein